MCKVLCSLISLILVLALAGNASAVEVEYRWNGSGDGSSWNDPLNWKPIGLPDSDDKAYFFAGEQDLVVTGASISHGVISGVRSTLTIKDGGHLTVDSDYDNGSYIMNAVTDGETSYWNVYDGTFNIDLMYVAFNGSGVLNLLSPDALVNVHKRKLVLAEKPGATGHIQLDAGVLRTIELPKGDGTASVDINGGTLVITGNVTSLDYVNATYFSGAGVGQFDYDKATNKTTITAVPEPANVVLLSFGVLALLRLKKPAEINQSVADGCCPMQKLI